LKDEVRYRLRLADGFLLEAKQDFKLERCRACVNDAQLAIENSGKAVLAFFDLTPKTHDPAQHVATLLRQRDLDETDQTRLQQLLPELLALGSREYFMTDYGDETTYTTPWDLYDRETAETALQSTKRVFVNVQERLSKN